MSKQHHWKPNTGRLQRGQTIRMPDGSACRVVKVNDCRARVQPVNRETTTFLDKLNGKKVTFSKLPHAVDISPNSEVEILTEAT